MRRGRIGGPHRLKQGVNGIDGDERQKPIGLTLESDANRIHHRYANCSHKAIVKTARSAGGATTGQPKKLDRREPRKIHASGE